MKKYSKWTLKRLTLDRHLRLEQLKPFPGKWPTRLWFVFVYPDGRRIRYMGKPSIASVCRMYKLYRRYDWKRCAGYEFDKTNVIAKFHCPDARAAQANLGFYIRASVYRANMYYHPSGDGVAFLWDMYAMRPNMQKARLRPHQYCKFTIRRTDGYSYYLFEQLNRENEQAQVQPNGVPLPEVGDLQGRLRPLAPAAAPQPAPRRRGLWDDFVQNAAPDANWIQFRDANQERAALEAQRMEHLRNAINAMARPRDENGNG